MSEAGGRRTPGDALAIAWLREVDGRLLCRRDDPHGPDGWVAVVKTPAAAPRRARVILGFGDSAAAAVETAREAWRSVWRELSGSVH